MKKVHPVLLKTIHQNLSAIFCEGKQADKVVQSSLKSNPKYGSRDRKFIAMVSYDMVRWWRKFHLEYQDFIIPSSIAISQAIHNYLVKNQFPIPKWSNFEKIPITKQQENQSFARIGSIPDWLQTIGENEVTDWEAKISAMNHEADVTLRTNSLKTTPKKLEQALLEEGVAVTQVDELTFIVNERRRVTNTKAYRNGLFEIQDLGSQKIIPFLDPKPKETIVDACSGAGGKTLQIADFIRNKGHILALDIYDHKLKELKKRSERNGYNCIETTLIMDQKSTRPFTETADRLLLDVPCSGLGVLKRNPGTKWFLKPEFLDTIRKTQSEIINSYSKMLKTGGVMVYATCSILPSENEKQIEIFLEANSNFKLIKEKNISPETPHSDGYYMAKMIRNY